MTGFVTLARSLPLCLSVRASVCRRAVVVGRRVRDKHTGDRPSDRARAPLFDLSAERTGRQMTIVTAIVTLVRSHPDAVLARLVGGNARACVRACSNATTALGLPVDVVWERAAVVAAPPPLLQQHTFFGAQRIASCLRTSAHCPLQSHKYACIHRAYDMPVWRALARRSMHAVCVCFARTQSHALGICPHKLDYFSSNTTGLPLSTHLSTRQLSSYPS